MGTDPVLQQVLDDLRMVRRGPGPFTADRLASAFVLIEYLGRGSTEHAYTALIDYVDRQDDDGTGDIAAFFYTCGLHVGGDPVCQGELRPVAQSKST